VAAPVDEPSFARLRERLTCTPLRGCPGRHVVHGLRDRTVEQIVGAPVAVRRCLSPRARDPVWIAQLADGGGIISYQHPDGTFVHTLCDADGFARKLAQLGIAPGPPPDQDPR
jgi:hypothetical protein